MRYDRMLCRGDENEDDTRINMYVYTITTVHNSLPRQLLRFCCNKRVSLESLLEYFRAGRALAFSEVFLQIARDGGATCQAHGRLSLVRVKSAVTGCLSLHCLGLEGGVMARSRTRIFQPPEDLVRTCD